MKNEKKTELLKAISRLGDMEKKTTSFGFRFEKRMGVLIRRFGRKNRLSFNALVNKALTRLGNLHDRGIMCLIERSRFLLRKDRKDRETTVLILEAKTREMVRNLAFSYRISMAEVIRLGLEMYLETEDRKSDNRIHIYKEPMDLIHTAIVALFPALPPHRIPYPLLL